MKAPVSRVWMVVALLGSGLFGQGASDLLQNVDRVLGRGDRAPTIDDVLGDTLQRIQGVDRMSAQAAAARLRECERELALYEALLKQCRGGLLVEVPRVGAPSSAATPEALSIERKKVEQLTRQIEDVEADLRISAESRPRPPAGEPRPTRMSDAILDVLVDVPPPAEGGRAGGAPALDPSGLSRALFVAGDFAGTLDALAQIPEERLTAEQRYRRARSLDQLGRLVEAKAAYEAVVAAERDGAYGRQAAWMLRLAKTREQVTGAVGGSGGGSNEQRRR